MKDLWGREPVMVAAFVHALLSLFVVFGVHLSTDQIVAIETVLSLGLGIIIRGQVHSQTSVNQIVAKVEKETRKSVQEAYPPPPQP